MIIINQLLSMLASAHAMEDISHNARSFEENGLVEE